jgi:hypothetical protein
MFSYLKLYALWKYLNAWGKAQEFAYVNQVPGRESNPEPPESEPVMHHYTWA